MEKGEMIWFGKERKKERLEDLFSRELVRGQRKGIEAAMRKCGNVKKELEQWATQ